MVFIHSRLEQSAQARSPIRSRVCSHVRPAARVFASMPTLRVARLLAFKSPLTCPLTRMPGTNARMSAECIGENT